MVLCPQPLKTSVCRISFRQGAGLHCKNVGKMLWLIQLLSTPHREVQQVRASGPIPHDLRRILHGCKNRLC